MLSALILVSDDRSWPLGDARIASLVRTLSSLVPHAMAGVVGDLALVAARDDPGLRTLADHAGCAVFCGADGFARARITATRPMLLVLREGAALNAAFGEEAAERLDAAAVFAIRYEPRTLAQRLLPTLCPLAGLIAPRGLFAALDAKPTLRAIDTRGEMLRARARSV